MNLLIELPSLDADLIAELKQLPGVTIAEKSHFDGADVVRISLEVAAVSVSVATTFKSAAAATKHAAEIVDTLRSIFRHGLARHRSDPNSDFVVTKDRQPFLNSGMSESEIDRTLAEFGDP